MRCGLVLAVCLVGMVLFGSCAGGRVPETAPGTDSTSAEAPAPTSPAPRTNGTTSEPPEPTSPTPKPTPKPKPTGVPAEEAALLESLFTEPISKCPDDDGKEARALCREEFELLSAQVDLVADGLDTLPNRPAYKQLDEDIESFRNWYGTLKSFRCYTSRPIKAATDRVCNTTGDLARSALAVLYYHVTELEIS